MGEFLHVVMALTEYCMRHCDIYSDTLWDNLGQILCIAQQYISAKTILLSQYHCHLGQTQSLLLIKK